MNNIYFLINQLDRRSFSMINSELDERETYIILPIERGGEKTNLTTNLNATVRFCQVLSTNNKKNVEIIKKKIK